MTAHHASSDVPAAIAPIDVLPVFYSLAGRRAVVVGGSAAAAWKAELLAAAGANLTIVAETLSAEMKAVVARSGCAISAGRVTVETFRGAVLVVIDAGDEDQARELSDLCREAGVPHNVIDRPAYGDFQFGTIVNRSPVVIGISTSGVAPILGQAIRQRIEAILPVGLATWAAFACTIRRRVTSLLAPGAQRRRFWEDLAARSLSAEVPPNNHDVDRWIADVADSPDGREGRVTLVGAGPGDPSLLTLGAVRALQSADVILYDALTTPEVLELARREATRVHVGKRAGRHSCSQDEISARMIALARAGKHVVRLKSGDPSIFGRAGEEIEAVEVAGIAIEIVPGVTAACAMASRLGASLTHRDHAHSVRFVTAHGRNGTLPVDIDWRGLADSGTSLIVYMAGATASAFARRLIQHGLDPDTPAVTAEALYRADERITRLSLRELARGGPTIGDGPVLLGIGTVFAAPATPIPLDTASLIPRFASGRL